MLKAFKFVFSATDAESKAYFIAARSYVISFVVGFVLGAVVF